MAPMYNRATMAVRRIPLRCVLEVLMDRSSNAGCDLQRVVGYPKTAGDAHGDESSIYGMKELPVRW
jgi:hypothetical protein